MTGCPMSLFDYVGLAFFAAIIVLGIITIAGCVEECRQAGKYDGR